MPDRMRKIAALREDDAHVEMRLVHPRVVAQRAGIGVDRPGRISREEERLSQLASEGRTLGKLVERLAERGG